MRHSTHSLPAMPPNVAMMFLPYTFDSARLQKRNAQGKVAELRLELNSGGKKDKNFSAKKTALKKIVANMTMSNNDMVALFPDIVGCMHIPSLEIKKMWVMLDT
jgi:AP-2 complex subunit beta-1